MEDLYLHVFFAAMKWNTDNQFDISSWVIWVSTVKVYLNATTDSRKWWGKHAESAQPL